MDEAKRLPNNFEVAAENGRQAAGSNETRDSFAFDRQEQAVRARLFPFAVQKGFPTNEQLAELTVFEARLFSQDDSPSKVRRGGRTQEERLYQRDSQLGYVSPERTGKRCKLSERYLASEKRFAPVRPPCTLDTQPRSEAKPLQQQQTEPIAEQLSPQIQRSSKTEQVHEQQKRSTMREDQKGVSSLSHPKLDSKQRTETLDQDAALAEIEARVSKFKEELSEAGT